MNGKIKAIAVVALILGGLASAIYMAPVLAYSNGTADQTRVQEIQDGECTCDCTCDCPCDCEQNQNQNQYQHHEQNQNQPSAGFNWQYCYEHQHRHMNMPSE